MAQTRSFKELAADTQRAIFYALEAKDAVMERSKLFNAEVRDTRSSIKDAFDNLERLMVEQKIMSFTDVPLGYDIRIMDKVKRVTKRVPLGQKLIVESLAVIFQRMGISCDPEKCWEFIKARQSLLFQRSNVNGPRITHEYNIKVVKHQKELVMELGEAQKAESELLGQLTAQFRAGLQGKGQPRPQGPQSGPTGL